MNAHGKKFSPQGDRQLESTLLSSVDGPPIGQCALPLSQPVDMSVIRAQKTFWDACVLAMSVAGLSDKQVYIPLRIDKGHWSRIASGEAHFPHNKLEAFLDLLGNDIPLRWLAWRRGLGLHMLESEQQRRLREKDDEIVELKKRLEWTVQVAQGRA